MDRTGERGNIIRRKHVYYICGTPYVGKTITVNHLCSSYDYHMIPEFFISAPKYFNKLTPSSDIDFKLKIMDWCFLQNICKNHRVEQLDGVIISDRSPLDYLAYCVTLGEEIYLKYRDVLLEKKWEPGILVLLKCSEPEALVDRMRGRDGLSAERSNDLYDNMIIPLEENFTRIFTGTGAITIENSRLDIPSMLSKVEKIIHENKCPTVDIERAFLRTDRELLSK